ncbi:hypothetical protein QQF64_014044 [Cirrhinus molitorella]|uniref:Uncharacterized protein n=1 Tax=Cirrhinus molitorella TaxID=172907 RepID=A0ABR3LSV2_9TELE
MSWEMVAGLAAWSDCGVSPLRNKDRGFSRARCHSAVALYRALRATRALLHPERSSEGVGREESGKKERLNNRTRLVRETTGSHDCDDLKETHSPPEKLFCVLSCAGTTWSAPQLHTDIMRYCPMKLYAPVITEFNVTLTTTKMTKSVF